MISTILETMTVTERLLSDCFGGAVRLGDGEDLGGSSRSKVYGCRCRIGNVDSIDEESWTFSGVYSRRLLS